MTTPVASTTARRLLVVAIGLVIALVGATPASAQEPPVDLGAVTSFAVLGGETVTNTGPTVVNGDLGVSPGSAVTNFPPGLVNGAMHAGNPIALGAQAAVVTAYDDTAGRSATVIGVDLVGLTLPPGVYGAGALELSGLLTLDGEGNPDAEFIFQSADTLGTASASEVVLINEAQPCNVYWQVSSSATLGTSSVFVGTILALTSISAQTGATIEGRLLARNGQVSLDSNVINAPACAAAGPPDTEPPTTEPPTTGPDDTTAPTPSPDDTTPAGGGDDANGSDGTSDGGDGTGGDSSTDTGLTTPSLPATGTSLTLVTMIGLLVAALGAASLAAARRRAR